MDRYVWSNNLYEWKTRTTYSKDFSEEKMRILLNLLRTHYFKCKKIRLHYILLIANEIKEYLCKTVFTVRQNRKDLSSVSFNIFG